MSERDNDKYSPKHSVEAGEDTADKGSHEVEAPKERVDDEVVRDEDKTTNRQE